MANKCAQLLNTLNDQQSRLEGSDLLQAAVDEVTAYVNLIPFVAATLIIEQNTYYCSII
jgi:hypothetical protein